MEFLHAQKIGGLFSPYGILPFPFKETGLRGSHFLVTQDQKSLSFTTDHQWHKRASFGMFRESIFLLIRNSTGRIFPSVSDVLLNSSLSSSTQRACGLIWSFDSKPGFRKADNSSIGWFSITEESILEEKRSHREHFSDGAKKVSKEGRWCAPVKIKIHTWKESV